MHERQMNFNGIICVTLFDINYSDHRQVVSYKFSYANGCGKYE